MSPSDIVGFFLHGFSCFIILFHRINMSFNFSKPNASSQLAFGVRCQTKDGIVNCSISIVCSLDDLCNFLHFFVTLVEIAQNIKVQMLFK